MDHASATPMLPEVFTAMTPYLTELFGNPGSIHTEGQTAKAAVTNARTKVARALSVQPECVTFTSGGTESNNLGIIGVVKARHESGIPYEQIEIITTLIEHPATGKTFEYLGGLGVVVKYVPVDEGGQIILSQLQALLTPATLLVSVAYVNSEIGVIQDIGAISRVISKYTKQQAIDIFLHIDAAQAPLWLPCELSRLGCDLMSLDAGKFGGPKGVGALVHQKRVPISPISFGGRQEQGLRPGTESVASIVGFAKAFELAQSSWQSNAEKVGALQQYFYQKLSELIPTAVINGVVSDARVVNNINVSIPGIDSEFAVVTLDVAGIAISTKSACSSAGGGASQVVQTITNDTARASTTLRFSLGLQTSTQDIDRALTELAHHVAKIRA
ncbi:cysteine desulfurase [Patescibacteria group bacterium]|nr:cysteine desulfurase [Patescibacteria group bacterium]